MKTITNTIADVISSRLIWTIFLFTGGVAFFSDALKAAHDSAIM